MSSILIFRSKGKSRSAQQNLANRLKTVLGDPSKSDVSDVIVDQDKYGIKVTVFFGKGIA